MKSASPNLLASASQNGDDTSMRSDPAANHDPSNLERLCNAVEQRDALATEAFTLAFLLQSKEVSSLYFAWVMQIVFDLGKMSPGWQAAFESVYERQSASRRILYRDAMTKLYLRSGDYAIAEKFLAARPELPEELADAMEVYLGLKRYDAAKTVAEICGQKMVHYRDPHSLRILLRTLRRYHRAVEAREYSRWELRHLIESVEGEWQRRIEPRRNAEVA